MTNLPPPSSSGSGSSSTPPAGSPPAGSSPTAGSSPAPPPPPPNLTPPPGYQSYNAAPTPMKPLARVHGLSIAVMVLTALAGIGAIVTAITTPGAIDDARDFLDGRISEDEFLDGYTAFGLTQSLQSIATIATAVVTIIWMYRMARNVRALRRATTWAPIWGVFSWILPPVLVIIPLLMLRELWKASDPDAPHDAHSWKQSSENPMLYVWFVLYGVVPTVIAAISFSTLFGGGFSQDADALAEGLDDFGTIQIVGAVVAVLSAVVWIIVVRQLTARHTRLTNET